LEDLDELELSTPLDLKTLCIKQLSIKRRLSLIYH